MNRSTYCDLNWVNSPHWVLRYGVHKVFGSSAAVTLTFDLLTPKSNQHISEP